MAKGSGPTAWTRGVSSPWGFCKTKPLRALAGPAPRGRDMGISFQEEGWSILNLKGRMGKIAAFFSTNPHTTGIYRNQTGSCGRRRKRRTTERAVSKHCTTTAARRLARERPRQERLHDFRGAPD